MSLCDRIEIHYINIDKRTSATSRDVYIADDVAIDGDKLTFSWLISGNATKYYGRLNFIILFECLDPDGNYTYKWNTEICKLLTIGEGISNTSAVIEDHSDILEKFRNEILEEAGEKSIQPDWNQNDTTAKDYVKNRPFLLKRAPYRLLRIVVFMGQNFHPQYRLLLERLIKYIGMELYMNAPV